MLVWGLGREGAWPAADWKIGRRRLAIEGKCRGCLRKVGAIVKVVVRKLVDLKLDRKLRKIGNISPTQQISCD